MKHDRMTERARLTMRHAKEEAARLGSNHASTEHVLLGLIAETDSVAVLALRNLGVDLAILRKKTIARVQDSSSSQEKDATQLSPSAKRAIQFAHQEAQSLGVNFIGTEHLLLGIIRETEGIAAKVLLSQRVDFVKTRAEILRLMGMGGDQSENLKAQPIPRPQEGQPGKGGLDRVDQRARNVMRRAKEEAARLGSNHASTEHVLLGLLTADTDSVAVTALRNLGVDLAVLRKETLAQIQNTTYYMEKDATHLSPSAKRAIQFAHQEAQSLGVSFIGTEHLLLGVIRESEGIAARVLLSQGVDLAKARAEILRLMGMGGG